MKSSPAGPGGSLKSKPTWSNPAGISASSAFLFHLEGNRSIVISLYSDGVPEAMNPAGKQFGDGRLLEAICLGRSESLQESLATLVREIARWQGTERAQEDLTVLAVEVSVVSALVEPGVASVEDPRASSSKQRISRTFDLFVLKGGRARYIFLLDVLVPSGPGEYSSLRDLPVLTGSFVGIRFVFNKPPAVRRSR
jgi:hypothetical protein